MRHLLDVNVLLALAWQGHAHNLRAATWYGRLPPTEIMLTCATTELGLVRALLNLAAVSDLAQAQAVLAAFKRSSPLAVQLIPDDLGADILPAYVKTARQTTDGHLLMLAAKHGAHFATFDAGIPGAQLIP